MKLLSREEVKTMDQKVVRLGQPQAALIESVGAKLSQWLHPKIAPKDRVLVVMGEGHNGDDAAVVHRRLRHHVDALFGLRLGKENSSFLHSEEQLYDLKTYQRLDFDQFDWIIDGLFGTGLNRPLSPAVQDLIIKINKSKAIRVAIDLPSGIDANTGQVHGQAIDADHTLTIAAPKRGLYLMPGRNHCGEIHCIEVTALNQVLNGMDIATQALPRFDFAGLHPARDANKYSRGAVSLALSEDFPGAALLTAFAAQHAGAGYVRVYCPPSLLQALQIQHPTLVFTPYSSLDHLSEQMDKDKSQTLVLGPGWKDWPKSFRWPLSQEKTFVLDCGLLKAETLQTTSKFANRCVITPHTGELDRLVGQDSDCKWKLVDRVLSKWKGVIIAKGHDTIIGQGPSRRWLTTWNSSSLAIAGSGDILAGILASFMAQGFPPQQASCLAVDAHRRLAADHPVCISPESLLLRIEEVLNNPEPLDEKE